MENKRTMGEILAEQKKVEVAQKGALRKAYRCDLRILELNAEKIKIEAGEGERSVEAVEEEKLKVARAWVEAEKKVDRCKKRLTELEDEKDRMLIDATRAMWRSDITAISIPGKVVLSEEDA